MESYDVVRLGLIFAIQAEIQGMVAENEMRKQNNECLAHPGSDFQEKADELRNVNYCHYEQL